MGQTLFPVEYCGHRIRVSPGLHGETFFALDDLAPLLGKSADELVALVNPKPIQFQGVNERDEFEYVNLILKERAITLAKDLGAERALLVFAHPFTQGEYEAMKTEFMDAALRLARLFKAPDEVETIVRAFKAMQAVTGVSYEPAIAGVYKTVGRMDPREEAYWTSFRQALTPRYGPDATKYYVYFARRSDGLIKIGTSKDPESRVRGIGTISGMAVTLLALQWGSYKDERALHRRFAAHRVVGEWFKPAPELLAHIEANAVWKATRS